VPEVPGARPGDARAGPEEAEGEAMTDAGTWALIYLFVDPLALVGGLAGLLAWRRRGGK
jgi:hypothetical protein